MVFYVCVLLNYIYSTSRWQQTLLSSMRLILSDTVCRKPYIFQNILFAIETKKLCKKKSIYPFKKHVSNVDPWVLIRADRL